MKDLLLLLCRYPFEEKNLASLVGLIGQVKDWEETVRLINAHGIIALAAYNLKEAGLGKDIPADAMAVLENGYMRNIVRNAWLTERWKEVNTLLCEAGIKHILLKGMALEHTLYGSKGLRQMNDTDILIKPEDSIRAWKLLQEHGFKAENFKSPLFKKIMFDLGQHLPSLCKNGYAIEIHNCLFDRTISESSRYKDPFEDIVEINVAETDAFILQNDLQLIYLISHFKHHAVSGDSQLRMYADIILLDKYNPLIFQDQFISDPIQSHKKEYRKAAYKARINNINPRHRFRFILGDTFPSMNWMKQRYGCNWIKALLMYSLRIGKLRWLF